MSGQISSVQIGPNPTRPCVKPATQITWNQTGPQGPPGPQGDTGPQGPPGTNALKQIPGRVNFDGSINAGTGFTVVHLGNGQYDIHFPGSTFTFPVNVQVTAVSSAVGGIHTALQQTPTEMIVHVLMDSDNNFQFLATQD